MATGGQKTTQTLHLNFDAGMDQRTHPRQTQAGGQVLEAVNIRYKNLGGVEKRPGMARVDDSFNQVLFSAGAQGKLIGNDNELIATDGYRIGSMHLVTAAFSRFTNRGQAPEAVSKLRPIDSSQYVLYGQDICYSTDGLIFHAWLAGGTNILGASAANDIYTSVEDATTGALLVGAESTVGLGNWSTPSLVACGNEVYLFYTESLFTTAPWHLRYRKWDRRNMRWGPITTLRSDMQGQIAVTSSNSSFYFAWFHSGGLYVARYGPGLVFDTETLILNASPPTIGLGIGVAIAVRKDDQLTWVSWGSINTTGTPVDTIQAAPYDVNLDQITPPFTTYTFVGLPLQLGICVDESTNNLVSAIGAATNGEPFTVFPVYDTSGNPVGNATPPNRTQYWVSPASKPFVRGDGSLSNPKRAYIYALVGGAIANPSNATTPPQYTHMLLELGIDSSPITWSARPITWQAPRYAITVGLGSVLFQLWGYPSVADLGNGTVVCDATIRRNNRQRVSLSSHLVDFNPQNRFLSAKLGQTVLMSPGFFWDKSKLAEISFAYWPQALDATAATSGGSLPDATYLYRALYEYIDANGFVHQSIPSDPVSITVSGGGGAGKVTLKVPCLTVTARQPAGSNFSGVRIVIYRQISTGVLSGAYLRLFAEGSEPLNDTTQQTITIVDDGATNISIGPNAEELYTDPGVFPNVMPASFTACSTYRNRVWVAYGHTVNYSKAFVTGSTVNFTDAFELPLEETGDITAMWKMDDTLYISTADSIYWLQADGPNDFGQQNDINTPNRVATDFGCIEPRSVVVTQVGTLYQSRAGIQLLKRDRSVSPEAVGARVQADLANFPTITAANLHPNGRICTFDCVNGSGQGIRLVYDYATDRWSRDTLLAANDQQGSYIISEAVAGAQQYTMISRGGSPSMVYVETPTVSYDDGVWVPMSVHFGEVHPLGLQGNVSFLKWTINQLRVGSFNASAAFYKDYETTAFDSRTILDATISAAPHAQISIDVAPNHRAQSMRMKLLDAPPASLDGTGKGGAWIGLAVELDPLDNKTFKLPAAGKV